MGYGMLESRVVYVLWEREADIVAGNIVGGRYSEFAIASSPESLPPPNRK